MEKINLQAADYAVSAVQGFSLSEAMRLWKTKYPSLTEFSTNVIKHPRLNELGDFVKEQWDNIQPVTVQEAFSENNIEKRRAIFDCIGVVKLFNELQPELLDKQVIHKRQTRWDENNQPYEKEYDDTYELYQLGGEKLFPVSPGGVEPNPVFAVRCWCTTTAREYWIYVPVEAALGDSWDSKPEPDAVRAIAWTIRIDITNPNRIFRQGDIIIVEESADSQHVFPHHLSKKQYLQLMFSET
ncbi:MAG: hypothetical protein E6Q24_05035 [Chitinophagaceae bacterium]|nr:MAG: hypothetical protein E6Q24_05035 [Chitinophagaceae bacterium]